MHSGVSIVILLCAPLTADKTSAIRRLLALFFLHQQRLPQFYLNRHLFSL